MKSYYVAGGTMLVSDASYVVRDADYLLRDRLVDGEFCYVLTPRQMGKSSLMVQTAHSLREQGVSSVTLDLSKHGFTLDAGQWYDGLLEMIGYGLGLEDEIDKVISDTAALGPLQRWQKAIRSVVLERISGPVVLFLDEIDITRRFKFETDEFFAAIRACYNQRAEDPAYRRLTFCLIGVATPADLIQDPMLTPFNIGTRVDLTDFTHQEASQLRLWLGKGDALNVELMDRIYYWTNGHPYLTQRLCKAVAEDDLIVSPGGVDQCCRNMFFATREGSIDDNLAFIRNWILPEDAEQRTQLLVLYKRVLDRKSVADTEADANVARLKLCGAVSSLNGRLTTRNRIYNTTFDTAWIRANMPGQELIRQRRAYIAGSLRVLVPAAIALIFISVLAITATRSARRASIAEGRSKRLLYDMDMYQAGESWEDGAAALTRQLLEYHSREPHEFAWNYLNAQRNAAIRSISSKSIVFHVAYSPNGRLVAAACLDGTVHIWDSASFRPVQTLSCSGIVLWIAFSPDGELIAAASHSAVSLWNVRTGRPQDKLTTNPPDAQSGSGNTCVAFSPVNANLLVAGDGIGRLRVWDRRRGSFVIGSSKYFVIHGLAFSPDGKQLAVTGSGISKERGVLELCGMLELWNTLNWTRTTRTLPHLQLNSPAYSPDGKLLAITQVNGEVSLWDAHSLQPHQPFKPFKDMADGVAFSHDGKLLAAASWDNTIRLWNVIDHSLDEEIKGCTDRVTSLDFSADNRTLVSGDAAGDVKLWNVADKLRKPFIAFSDQVHDVALSPTEPLLAVVSGKRITLWNLRTQEMAGKAMYPDRGGHYTGIVFSRDGKSLMSAGRTNEVRRWDVKTQNEMVPGYECPGVATTGPIALSSDGTLLAAATGDVTVAGNGAVVVWDATTCALINKIRVGSNPSCLTFSHDGARIVAADGNNVIHVWNARSGKLLATLQTLQRGTITSLAWSPDGKSIASTCWDKTVRLWDASTYKPYALLQGNNADVLTCCFSSDSQYLITAGEDKQIKYWDIKLAREDPRMARQVLTLKGHTELVRNVVISDDSRLVVSQDQHTVRFWRAGDPW